MTDKKKKNRKAISIGIVGLASIAGVSIVGLVIGLGADSKRPVSAVKQENDWAQIALENLDIDGTKGAKLLSGQLIISGDVANENDRAQAFQKAKSAVIAKLRQENSNEVSSFYNAITINGQTIEDLPDTLSLMGENPEAAQCQNAYNTLLEGRVINFNSGSAIIAPESKMLLDGLSDVAIRCINYNVEVGGHTDSDGDEFANQSLSERRAQSVADYLVGKGVNAANLIVKGYGETRPIDNSGTEEADAKNRRIELKVTQKA